MDPTTHAGVYLNFLFYITGATLLPILKVFLAHTNAPIFFQLALKDAEKVMNAQNASVKSFILKANSLILVRIHNWF